MHAYRFWFSLALATTVLSLTTLGQQSAPAQRPRSPLPLPTDCNENGIPDRTDIAQGTSADCDGNFLPDECDIGEVVLYAESFEGGGFPADWTVFGSWIVSDQCPSTGFCDGGSYAYFGDDSLCTFETSSLSGFLGLPPIPTPAGVDSLSLVFCYTYQGEGAEPYDAADVFVNNTLVSHLSPEWQLEWAERRIDLTPLAGETLDISFEFNAMDSFLNEYLGWKVDHVRVVFGLERGVGDCDEDGVLDACEPDCDRNGSPDACDLALTPADDCDRNGVPDACETAAGTAPDCNLNGVPDACDLEVSLHGALANLETSSATIGSFFTDRFDFTEGEVGTCIQSGGLSMFFCGNRLRTDQAVWIPYTNGVVVDSTAFGPQSSYFTAKYDGLFVLAATGVELDTFWIDGLNSLGGGDVDSLEQTISVDGDLYTYYVKRVYGVARPSVNQIIVVPGDGTGITHTYSPLSAESLQTLSGLAGVDRLYYALVSRYDGVGLALRPVDAREIVRELVGSIPGPVSADVDLDGVPDECP